jgi:hypothetical protein
VVAVIRDVLRARMHEGRQVSLVVGGREVSGTITDLDEDGLVLVASAIDVLVIRVDAVQAIGWNEDTALIAEPLALVPDDDDPPAAEPAAEAATGG